MISLIFSQPWWKRIWIVQEVVVAASPTVRIGVYEVPISLFITAADGYYQHFPCCSTGDLFNLWWYGSHEVMSTLKASTRCARFMGDVKRRFDNSSLNLLDAVVLSRNRRRVTLMITYMHSWDCSVAEKRPLISCLIIMRLFRSCTLR